MLLQGLNPLMFVFALVGNATYVARWICCIHHSYPQWPVFFGFFLSSLRTYNYFFVFAAYLLTAWIGQESDQICHGLWMQEAVCCLILLYPFWSDHDFAILLTIIYPIGCQLWHHQNSPNLSGTLMSFLDFNPVYLLPVSVISRG